ncbi:pyrrolo-quinoline quinone [Natronococcus pandeyae]|uniref:Pyrrolo-quinoline quinone n=1 Tax=Natronococcus pandeyae TaxID=2055836 RepID=A0A8J8TPK0_9EURY|nr:PQQ-binding-like beta-propeller repeat protein [Natronococcus pandeyae]TYL37836.1 pyrrolo-quinoline quinone [Natronococcus pandeyae]
MDDWQRRSVLATGAALSAGGIFASLGAGEPTSDGSRPQLDEPDGWSSYGGTAGNTRHNPSISDFEKPETVAWQYDETGDAAVVDGRVYLRTGEEVHALDADDGSRLWTCPHVHAAGTPAVTRDGVYVAGDQLTAIDADSGAVRWSETFGTDVSVSAPVVAFETVYVTVEGTLHAFDVVDGSRRWTCETVAVTSREDDSGTHTYVFSTRTGAIAAADGMIWALLDKRRSGAAIDADALVAFDPVAGETLWSDHLEPGGSATGLTVTETTSFLENSSEEDVTVFDTASKEEQQHLSDALVTAVAGDRVVTRGRHRLKLSSPCGSWEKNGTYSYGAPAIAGETVVVAHSLNGSSTADELVGYDLESGDEQWRFTFDESQWTDGFGVDCVVDGETVYLNRDGGLTALCPSGRDTANRTEKMDGTTATEEDC